MFQNSQITVNHPENPVTLRVAAAFYWSWGWRVMLFAGTLSFARGFIVNYWALSVTTDWILGWTVNFLTLPVGLWVMLRILRGGAGAYRFQVFRNP